MVSGEKAMGGVIETISNISSTQSIASKF